MRAVKATALLMRGLLCFAGFLGVVALMVVAPVWLPLSVLGSLCVVGIWWEIYEGLGERRG